MVQTAVDRKLSEAVALKFQKTRTLYLGYVQKTLFLLSWGLITTFIRSLTRLHVTPWLCSKLSDAENGSNSGVGVEEKSCNGEKFLWCMAGEGKVNSSDVEDLADFIVCEPEKDYSNWLKGRERFRSQKWMSGRIALQRWNKKQKAWRENKRK